MSFELPDPHRDEDDPKPARGKLAFKVTVEFGYREFWTYMVGENKLFHFDGVASEEIVRIALTESLAALERLDG